MDCTPSSLLPIFVLYGQGAEVTAVCFVGSDKFLVSGGSNGGLCLWDLSTLRCTSPPVQAHSSTILTLERIEDEHFISQSMDTKLKLWKIGHRSFSCLQELNLDMKSFCKANVYVEPGKPALIAVPGESSLINVYRVFEDIPVVKGIGGGVINRDDGLLMCIKMYNLGDLEIISGYESGMVCIWNLFGRELIWRTKIHEEPVTCLYIEGNLAFTGGADCIISEINISNKTWAITKVNPSGIADIKAKNQILLVAHWDGRIYAYSLNPLKYMFTIYGHREAVNCLTVIGEDIQLSNCRIMRCNKIFASGSRDESIRLWSL